MVEGRDGKISFSSCHVCGGVLGKTSQVEEELIRISGFPMFETPGLT
jgi:hypothetical protein